MKISVITACFNSEKSIRQTIESVMHQDYKDIEYLIIDGGSTDGTLGIVREYEDRIDRIVSEEDQGIYDAFNKGIRLATGDILFFLNSDDWLIDEQVLSEVAQEFTKDQELLFLYGGAQWLFPDGHTWEDNLPLTLIRIHQGKICPHQGTFYHKEFFEKYQGFDLKYHIVADAELAIIAFLHESKRMRHFHRIISVFRVGGASTDLANRKRLIHEKEKQLCRHFGTYYGLKYRCREFIYRRFIQLYQLIKKF